MFWLMGTKQNGEILMKKKKLKRRKFKHCKAVLYNFAHAAKVKLGKGYKEYKINFY